MPRGTDEELIAEVENQRNLVIAVATGGPRIDTVNPQYIERRARIAAELRRRNIGCGGLCRCVMGIVLPPLGDLDARR